MAETNLESGQQAGSAGTTNSDASQNTGVQPTSTFNAEELLKQLEPLIDKKVQSVKDRRFAEQEQFRSEFQPVLERFKDLVSPEQMKEIQKELEFEDLKRRVYGNEQTSEPVSAGNTQAPVVNTAQAFAEMELDFKDPRVQTALTKQYDSQEAAELAAFKLRKQIQSSPAPTPAQGASLQGKPPVAQDVAAKTEQYKTDMLAARGNEGQLTKIREQAIKDGVPVWAIDFS